MSTAGNRPSRPRSTLQDVARKAGVSATTVSLVLADKATTRRISEDTHRRVRGAAAELGYTPSLLHRSMRRGRTHVLSLYNAFRNREWSDLYMDRLSAAIEHAGGNLGYDVLVHCSFRRDTRETYEFLNGGLSDGLILFGPNQEEPLLPLLRGSNLPVVLIGPRSEESFLSTVRDDGETGMRLVAEAIVSAGHTRVAAVVDRPDGQTDPTGRIGRLRLELAARGIAFSDEDLVVWNDSPEEMVARLRALPSRPTVAFVWHDRAAYRIVEACEASGLHVPDELSIVGYDGLVWPSTTGHVVTSTAVALDEVGRAAVSLLDRLIEGETGTPNAVVPVSFLPGTTLGPPPPSVPASQR